RGRSDLAQRQLLLDGADVEGDLGHAVDHRAGLVLAERAGAGLAKVQEALRAVAAHAREDDAERAVAIVRGEGGEQHVHGGPLTAAASTRRQRRLDVPVTSR